MARTANRGDLDMEECRTEERFVQLETKISHQEFLQEEFHQVLCQQQEMINHLQKKIRKLEEQIQSGVEIRPAGEKPPHY